MWKLRLSMFGTLAFIIGISTLFIAALLAYMGTFNIYALALIVAAFNVLQWLFAPKIVNAMYRVKPATRENYPWLYDTVERLSERSGLRIPKIMIANVPIPNAFAYGSPIYGNHVAVTQGLFNVLDKEEIEAVLGHELGHLRHRDVQVMMLASFLPAIFYFIGRWAMFSAYFGGARRERGGATVLIGLASMAVYFVLLLFILNLSRLREYYADSHSASIVDEGSRKLSEGLAKIVSASGRMRLSRRQETPSLNAFKTLFISDPDSSAVDAREIAAHSLATSDRALVRKLLKRKPTFGDRLIELFSTHPNITKRLMALQKLGA